MFSFAKHDKTVTLGRPTANYVVNPPKNPFLIGTYQLDDGISDSFRIESELQPRAWFTSESDSTDEPTTFVSKPPPKRTVYFSAPARQDRIKAKILTQALITAKKRKESTAASLDVRTFLTSYKRIFGGLSVHPFESAFVANSPLARSRWSRRNLIFGSTAGFFVG